MIDARRMEVYAALFDQKNIQIREIKAEIITENSFEEEFKTSKIVFGGDGADKCKTLLSANSNAIFLNDFHPSSKYMVKMALEKFEKACFEDVAYFEPFYLKDFVAGIPRVKGLQ
jgi:tRNA threonylcarbamoyladenosine biosynthesis protein TsaB